MLQGSNGNPVSSVLVLMLLQVLTIDGQSTDGWDGDRAAKNLRGKSGSSVNVRFARRTEQTPGVAGRPEEPLKRVRLDPDAYQYTQVCRPCFPLFCFSQSAFCALLG